MIFSAECVKSLHGQRSWLHGKKKSPWIICKTSAMYLLIRCLAKCYYFLCVAQTKRGEDGNKLWLSHFELFNIIFFFFVALWMSFNSIQMIFMFTKPLNWFDSIFLRRRYKFLIDLHPEEGSIQILLYFAAVHLTMSHICAI